MDRVAVTLTSTGQLLRWTSGDTDPSFDAATETSNALSAPVVIAAGVPQKYYKVSAGVAVEMSQAEKDVVDATVDPAVEQLVKERTLSSPLDDIAVSVTAALLVITSSIESLVDDDETTIVADPTDTKFALVCYVYNDSTDAFSLQVFEKTTGLYADLLPPEYLVEALAEFSVVAGGTELVEV